MRILIFGENGQVARTLRKKAEALHIVDAYGRARADLLIPGEADKAIRGTKPDVVINAAAYTAVDKAESNPDEAQRLNGEATGEIAAAAKREGAQFIHLSTDYVFNGNANIPYKENAEASPINVYGASKLQGERSAIAANPECIIVRTSWVFSPYGRNFVETMLRLGREHPTLSIIDDQTGGPTSSCDISDALLTIADKKHHGAPGKGVYHFQSKPAVTWAGFAEEIFKIAGLTPELQRITTEEYGAEAKRPRYSVLDCSKIEQDFNIPQPDWRQPLRNVIGALCDEEARS